jgi:hypothetical protein
MWTSAGGDAPRLPYPPARLFSSWGCPASYRHAGYSSCFLYAFYVSHAFGPKLPMLQHQPFARWQHHHVSHLHNTCLQPLQTFLLPAADVLYLSGLGVLPVYIRANRGLTLALLTSPRVVNMLWFLPALSLFTLCSCCRPTLFHWTWCTDSLHRGTQRPNQQVPTAADSQGGGPGTGAGLCLAVWYIPGAKVFP